MSSSIYPSIKEGSYGHVFTASFFDVDDAGLVPNSITYRVDCLTNGQEIVADTAVAAAASVEIKSVASWANIIDTNNATELRRLSVTGVGGDWKETAEFLFRVRQMKRLD